MNPQILDIGGPRLLNIERDLLDGPRLSRKTYPPSKLLQKMTAMEALIGFPAGIKGLHFTLIIQRKDSHYT